MEKKYIAALIIMGIGGGIIGWYGGGMGVIGLLLVCIGNAMARPRYRSEDASDMFEEESIGKVQARSGDNYPPGHRRDE